MQGRGEMRAADSDRQVAAERLRVAVDEGRLDLYEYDERLRAAYGSKTYAELDGLLSDLPEPAVAERARSVPTGGGGPADSLLPGPGWRCPGATRSWLAESWTPYLSVVGLAVAGWAIFSIMAWEPLYFWPVWVAGPWGALLLVSTVGGLLRGEPQRVARRRARKKAAKRARRQGAAPVAAEPSTSGDELPEHRRWGGRDDWQLGGRAG